MRPRFLSHFRWIAIFVAVILAGSASAGLGAGVSARKMLQAKFPVIQFNEVELGQVIDYLRNVTGVNFFVDWPALEAVGVTRRSTVTLKLKAMPMGTALHFILRSAGGTTPLQWWVDDNVIQIASRPAADTQLVTRVYAVRDLLLVVPDFTDAPDFDLSSIGQSSAGGRGGGGNSNLFRNTQSRQEDKDVRKEQEQALIDLITRTIRPEIWRQNGGPASIRIFNGNLIVTAPREVQKAIGGKM